MQDFGSIMQDFGSAGSDAYRNEYFVIQNTEILLAADEGGPSRKAKAKIDTVSFILFR
jgi:hypothetical protein